MNTIENTETAKTKERKSSRNWKESYVIFLVLPVIFTILFPLGGLFYLCGRFVPYGESLTDVCLLYPVICIFIIYCLFVGIDRLSGGWRKNTEKKKLLIAAEIAIPLVFIVSLLVSFFTSIEGMIFFDKPFLYGLRDGVKNEADIEAIRDWLQTLSKEDYTFENVRIPPAEWPESLKVLRPRRVYPLADENGNRKVRFGWGGGIIGHWGVEIGSEDMEIPPSDFSQYGEYRLPVQAGVYVWRQLE